MRVIVTELPLIFHVDIWEAEAGGMRYTVKSLHFLTTDAVRLQEL